MSAPQKPKQLPIEVPADLKATYANFSFITLSSWEVFIDFVQVVPNVPKARVQDRVVLSPAGAKMLMRALQTGIERFESQHGEIKLPPRPQSLADQLFSSIRSSDDPEDAPEGEEPANE